MSRSVPPTVRPGRLRAALVALLLALATAASVPATAAAAEWQPLTPRLSTQWTSQVGPGNALPEYPRPQLTRGDWANLNGVWQWASATAGQAPPIGTDLPRRILVPYPAESALSGIGEHTDRMYYRRTFTVPQNWSPRRVLLNFGAVDWQSRVWVNGKEIGTHDGGYTRFSFDITDALRAGENELVVGVYDPTDAGGQPVGKQANSPSGIFYTAYSGIWQTVWLEPVTAAHLTRLDMTPDVAGGTLRVIPRAVNADGASVRISVRSGGTEIGAASGAPGAEIRVPVPNARLWSPADPFLYDVQATLLRNGQSDVVGSYAGMRSVGKASVGGVLRPTLNGKPFFALGTLDQGYWPDGLSTAPTDEALRFDIQQHKDLGFNTIRKHIKVEPDRWYYWADRIGLMVWQDMPAMTPKRSPDTASRTNFETELRGVLDELRSYPSIVQWVPFNEGWGEYDPARIADAVRAQDPSRLVNNNSGSNCCGFDGGNGDVVDDHIYPGAGTPQRPSSSRIAALGEFGGIGLRVPGHEWQPGAGFGYDSLMPDGAAATQRYLGLMSQVQRLRTSTGLSAAIYTELTDVENEVNGLFTYDRAVLKPDRAKVRAANLAVLADTPVYGTASVPRNTPVSVRVTTPGFTDRSLRHQDSLAYTSVVTSASPALLRADATWRLVPGLADASCVSLESANYPNEFLRHADSRVRRDADDGSALMHADATWCPRPGLSGSDTSFESFNYPGKFLRHYDAEVWLANNGGPPAPAYNAPGSYPADTTWHIDAPW